MSPSIQPWNLNGRKIEVLATVDHPYASPPTRLIGAHRELADRQRRGQHVALCVWDVNPPNQTCPRAELVFDTGLLSPRMPSIQLFSTDQPYPLQEPRPLHQEQIQRELDSVLGYLRRPRDEHERLQARLEHLLQIYTQAKKDSSSLFGRDVLRILYREICLEAEADMLETSTLPYWNHSISNDWIPACIEEHARTSHGVATLMNLGIFRHPTFTSFKKTKDGTSRIPAESIDIDERAVAQRVRIGQLIPSYEVLFWCLAMNGIGHFGNDYGTFDRLDAELATRGFTKPGCISALQLTRHNEDGVAPILFRNSLSYSIDMSVSPPIIQRAQPPKITRVQTVTALYLHLGPQRMAEILKTESPIPHDVTMGMIA